MRLVTHGLTEHTPKPVQAYLCGESLQYPLQSREAFFSGHPMPPTAHPGPLGVSTGTPKIPTKSGLAGGLGLAASLRPEPRNNRTSEAIDGSRVSRIPA